MKPKDTARPSLTTLSWVLTNFLGWFFGIVLLLSFSISFDAIGLEGYQFFMGLSMGLGVGWMQWRALKSHVSARWLLFNTLGMTIPFLMIDLLHLFLSVEHQTLHLALAVALGGILAGLGQYSLIRYRSSNAWLWIPGSMISWVGAALTVLALDYTSVLFQNNWLRFASNLTLILAGGVVLGWISIGFLRKIWNSSTS